MLIRLLRLSTKKKKYDQEKSELAKKYSIRISKPAGYFPEDVDRVIIKLENEIKNLNRDKVKMEAEIERSHRAEELAKESEQHMKEELGQLRLQVQLIEVPDTSTVQDFDMLNKINRINDTEEEALPDYLFENPSKQSEVKDIVPVKFKPLEDYSTDEKKPHQQTFNDLITKRKDKGGD